MKSQTCVDLQKLELAKLINWSIYLANKERGARVFGRPQGEGLGKCGLKIETTL